MINAFFFIAYIKEREVQKKKKKKKKSIYINY